jgi:hypothetical protein
LRDEYSPEGKVNINLDLLGNYLRFLQKNLRVQLEQVSRPQASGEQPGVETIINPSDEKI